MNIFAHRGNLIGTDAAGENSLWLVEKALEGGFSIETDLRRGTNGSLYVSHDSAEVSPANLADVHARLWATYPDAEIALNVKELGYEEKIVEFLVRQRLTQQAFLFDFELLESTAGSTAKRIHEFAPTIRLAARVSDRNGESIEQAEAISSASVVWLDEFDSLWVSREDVARLKALGRLIYAISPEIHGFSMQEAEVRWKQFREWGVDGICTDYPIRLRAALQGN